MPLKSLGGSADHLQSGPENDRPKPAVQGEVRFNTDSEDFEIWEGVRWVSMRPPVQAPITDTDRTLGLALGRGVQAPEQLLEAYLGKDLGFDAQGRIEYQGAVDWSQLPACPGGGLVWDDKCWTLLEQDPTIHWDAITGKPNCFPACDTGDSSVDWSDIKNKPACFPACDDGGGGGDGGGGNGGGGVTKIKAGTNITISPSDGLGVVTINSTAGNGGGGNGGGGGGTVCINKDEKNLQLDSDGCLEFIHPDDGDDDWPSYAPRMYGHISPKGEKATGEAQVTYASPDPSGNPCVTINATGFPQVDGENKAWEIDLKFSTPIKTDRYEVFLTPGDGSYDHCMTYLKDSNAKKGFKVYMHDLENNVALNGDEKRADSNHVAAFSFMVVF